MTSTNATTSSEFSFRVIPYEDVPMQDRLAVPAEALEVAQRITADVRKRGKLALREYAQQFDKLQPNQPLILGPEEMQQAARSIPTELFESLCRTAKRIRKFAEAQRESLREFSYLSDGMRMGQRIVPLASAGCYAPSGRFPLPSSVLMTVIPARIAGVEKVIVASPSPHPVTLAAASIAGADLFLCAGGAQAIAAMAYGADDVPRCDVVVGPGNRFVTAAKQIISGTTRIDMLAGPSEIVVIADASSNARLIAADLLAQAEHDPDAMAILVALDPDTLNSVTGELNRQLVDLPTRDICLQSLSNSYAICVRSVTEAATVANQIAPEHLEIVFRNASNYTGLFTNYGALFVGDFAAEVLGDYGAGPNHTLPTGGSARTTGGLSVLNFLAIRTWMEGVSPASLQTMLNDCENLAQSEGLEGHRRAIAFRRTANINTTIR